MAPRTDAQSDIQQIRVYLQMSSNSIDGQKQVEVHTFAVRLCGSSA
jgi:hypothetical protein